LVTDVGGIDFPGAQKMIFAGVDWANFQAGIYHLASSNSASRYELACAIGAQLGYGVDVQPSSTRNFPTLASRPRYIALNSEHFCGPFRLRMPTWGELSGLALRIFQQEKISTRKSNEQEC
jgi:dTDP-4-dehydrorhamnose reductase